MLTNTWKYGKFEPKYENLKHQQEAFDILKDKPYFALFLEQGLGKTKVMIDNMVYLFLKQEIDGVFIIAPKSAYLNWLQVEIPIHMPNNIPFRIHFWDADWTDKQRREASDLLIPKDDMLDIFLMNCEALTTERAFWFAEKFCKIHFTMGICDESTWLKSAKAKRTKAVWKLRDMMDYRRILTGTPLVKNPLDIFAQAEFLEHGLLGFESFHAFKNYYSESRRITLGTRSFDKIIGFNNIDELKRKIAHWSYRKLKTECLDLPDKVFETRLLKHTEEEARIYKELKREALTVFSDDSMVTSNSVLTTLMKLHQVNCGHVTDDFGTIVDISRSRIDALLDIVEEIDGKILIWCHFKEDVRRIVAALAKEYGDHGVVDYYGDTGTAERQINLEHFKRNKDCRFFVSNQTGSKALTLVQATYSIYYSYSHNLETWLQSQDRNHRIGTTEKITYIIMMIAKTVDETIIKSLMNKKDLADEVLDNWRLMLDPEDTTDQALSDVNWTPE